jgi:hypothetical protein
MSVVAIIVTAVLAKFTKVVTHPPPVINIIISCWNGIGNRIVVVVVVVVVVVTTSTSSLALLLALPKCFVAVLFTSPDTTPAPLVQP